MPPHLDIQDFHQKAIHVAGRVVVAAVKGVQSGAKSARTTSTAAQEPAVAVAGVVAEMLEEDPSIEASQMKDCLLCDYLFASSSEILRKGLDLDDLLAPIHEALGILIEYRWLHEIVTQRLIEHGEISEKQLHDTLLGGPEDLRGQPSSSFLPMLVCILTVFIVDEQLRPAMPESLPPTSQRQATDDVIPAEIAAIQNRA